ncbi:FHA domain-containing protein [bacterium]|nr:FHA domain-containing protein [bacterium]
MGDNYFLVGEAGNATEVAGEIKIGRNKTNELVISDPLASRHHATVYMEGETLMIRDEGSSNGTLVNGTQIYEPTALNDQDKIQFGDEEYIVRAPLWDSATIRAPQEGEALASAAEPAPKKMEETSSGPQGSSEAVEGEVLEPPKKDNKTIIIIAAVVLLLCICCLVVTVIVFFVNRNSPMMMEFEAGFNQVDFLASQLLAL